MDEAEEVHVWATAVSASAADETASEQLIVEPGPVDDGRPFCKICHMPARDDDPLISPCRCSGTVQYIHCGCLTARIYSQLIVS